MRYLIISPVKNEADHIGYTIASILKQTVRPDKWIIVDDGSTDTTRAILHAAAEEHAFITIIEKQTQLEERSGGSKVVKAFKTGLETVNYEVYDFIVKLDGDLELPENYFETIIRTFESDPKIGICGGYILNKYGDAFIREKSNDYHVRGAFKSVRTACFRQIGGFRETWNWDGLDEMGALFLGWKTKVLELPVKHFRPTSQAYNPYRHAVKSGVEYYKMRTDLLLTLLRFAARLPKKPYIGGACCFLYGYFSAFFNRSPRTVEKDLGKFINRFHYKRIFS
jgi:glycosyltransferase involved in cell wall biosynthesis